MNYEQKYKEALERAKEMCALPTGKATMEYIFPELKESEDERIRKAIISILKGETVYTSKEDTDKYVDWLEKQGKQNHAELGQLAVTKTSNQELEPKFKVGDWVISNDGTHTYLVKERKRGIYVILDIGEDKEFCIDIETADRTGRLWTIQDAKDGDVLTYVTDEGDSWIMIYRSLYEPYEGHVHYHALLVNNDSSDKGTCCISINNLKPATKEQRDLLFQKMKEAGYEWDSKKKELKKMGVTSKEIDDAYLQGICDAKHELEKQGKKLDADEVIEWLNNQACQGWIIDVEIDKFVKKFKKYFGL